MIINKVQSSDKSGVRAAIYARVSTVDKQEIENQVDALIEYCTRRGLIVTEIYADKGWSGAREDRPEFKRMMKDAFERRFDVLVAWKLDRLSRSLKQLVNTLEELERLNIDFICLTQNLDTTSATGKLMFHVIGAFAEFERGLIRERVMLGVTHAQERGVKFGRPKSSANIFKIKALRGQGLSLRQIAKETGTSYSTVSRLLQNPP